MNETNEEKILTPISVVLPMYNESACVATTLQTALELISRRFANFEIVIADDASTDDSPAQVAAWAEKDPRIRLVRLAVNQKFGGALRAGMAAARNEYIFYTDFDLQVGLECLPEMLEHLVKENVVLTGYSAHVVKHVNLKSHIISIGYNTLVRVLFGIKLRDINFGFKALRKSLHERMSLHSCSPFVDAELFVQAKWLGSSVKQLPVPFHMRQAGVSRIRRLGVILLTFRDMFYLRLGLFSQKPDCCRKHG